MKSIRSRKAGVAVIEAGIRQRDQVGDRTLSAFSRILLAEIYIRLLHGSRKASWSIIIKNLPFLLGAKLFGARKARALLEAAAAHRQFSADGVVAARIVLNLGLLAQRKGDAAAARDCRQRALQIANEQRDAPLLRRIESELLV